MYCCNELVIYWQLASFLTLAVVSGESVDALAAELACRRRRADAAVQTRLAAAVRVCVRQHPHLSLSTPAGRARYGVHLRLSVCLSVCPRYNAKRLEPSTPKSAVVFPVNLSRRSFIPFVPCTFMNLSFGK